MANVKLEWLQETYTESFNIYRSDGPMNTASMPAPLATGITNSYYFDTSITVGETYFYRVGAVRGEQELISSEIEVLAGAPAVNDPQWSNVQLLLFADATTFPSTTFVDSSQFARTIKTSGSPSLVGTESLFDNGAFYIPATPISYFGFGYSLGIGTGDFTAECFLKIANDAVSNPFDAFIIHLSVIRMKVLNNDATYKTFQINTSTGTTYSFPALAASAIGSWHHFCMMRKNGIVYSFIDGVLMHSFAYTTSLTSTTYFGRGATDGRAIKGFYNSCRVTTAARYSETGFTVPTEKFPTS